MSRKVWVGNGNKYVLKLKEQNEFLVEFHWGAGPEMQDRSMHHLSPASSGKKVPK